MAFLSGCGGGQDASGAATPSPPPADGGYYTDPRAIVDKASGVIPCADLQETPDPRGTGVLRQVTCRNGDIVIRVHENRAGVDAQIDFHKLTGGQLLTGQNWTVNAPDGILIAARAHLGGKVVYIPCLPPDCKPSDLEVG